MTFNVNDEIQWLTTTILPEILKNGRLVENYNASELHTFKVGDIEIKLIGAEEAYMLTQCYRAKINFEFAGRHELRKLVIKKTPQFLEGVQFDKLFYNEILFYTEILPAIEKLSNVNFAAPKYYHSDLKSSCALLILGDFGVDDWRLAKDSYGLSLEHARVTVKYLARFHAFGYTIKHTQNELFQRLTGRFKDARFSEEIQGEWALMLKGSNQRIGNATTIHQPDVDGDFVKKVLKMMDDYVVYARQRVAPYEPLATLCHGDYLRNNIAYKYDTDNIENPVDVMMFDFQTMRYSSPMLDLSTFMNLSLLADVRQKHFDSLFDDYCTALFESYTKNTKLPLPDFLSREHLLKEYIKFLPFSIRITAYFLMSLIEPVDMTDIMNGSNISEETILQLVMTQGGEKVDHEIAQQMREMFDLSRKYNVQIDENIDYKYSIDNVAVE